MKVQLMHAVVQREQQHLLGHSWCFFFIFALQPLLTLNCNTDLVVKSLYVMSWLRSQASLMYCVSSDGDFHSLC